MKQSANKWFQPGSLLSGMALVFDFSGQISGRRCEAALKEIRERRQKLFEELNRPDAEKIAGDWRKVGNDFRTVMAAAGATKT